MYREPFDNQQDRTDTEVELCLGYFSLLFQLSYQLVLVFSVQKPHHSNLSIKENILLELKVALCMGKNFME